MGAPTKLKRKQNKAAELGIEFTPETTEAELDALIAEKQPSSTSSSQSLTVKRGTARRLKVIFNDDTSEEELDELIAEAEERAEQAKKEAEILKGQEKLAIMEQKNSVVVLRNTNLEDVKQEDYFFPRVKDEKTLDGFVLKATDQTAPSYFNKVCGMPVDFEEFTAVFDSIFPKDRGFLFYKVRNKEVYIVIVPLKYARTVSRSNDSIAGDFQHHAMSFVGEGSVGIDSLKSKLSKIYNHNDISKEPLF